MTFYTIWYLEHKKNKIGDNKPFHTNVALRPKKVFVLIKKKTNYTNKEFPNICLNLF